MIHLRRVSVVGIAALLAMAFPAAAGFVRTWGGTGSTAPANMAIDGASNVYVVGSFSGRTDFDPGPLTNAHTSAGLRDAFLSKFSADGTWQWTRVWGGTNDDRANSVAVCGSNVYVVGCFQDTVDFNPSGGDSCTAPRGTNGFPNNDAFLVKYAADGAYGWVRAWGGNGGDEAYDVVVDGQSGVYVCGDFSTTNMDLGGVGLGGSVTNLGRWDAFFFKFSLGGTCGWARCWGGAYYDDCTCLAVDGAGNVFGAGMFASLVADFDPGPGTYILHANNPLSDWGMVDVFLTAFDSDGGFRWARSWGSSNHWDAAQGVGVDRMTNVYVSGYFADVVDFNPLGLASNLASHGGDDAFLCRYGPGGSLHWARTWGGSSNDYARALAVDGDGYVYVSGDLASTNADVDPGEGVDLRSSNGKRDIAFSKFAPDGSLLLARTCGGGADDDAFGGVVADEAGHAYESGSFLGTFDFGPLVGVSTSPPSAGTATAFLAQVPTAWPLTITRSGSGGSTLGQAASATRFVSLGMATQIVYTASDWYRIQYLLNDGLPVDAAAGQRVFTQVFACAVAGVTSEVAFALASPAQSGYTNVPTAWLTNWTESAVIPDAALDVYSKYLLGLDPTTSNSYELRFTWVGMAATGAELVITRSYTGGLSPDGMHGRHELQSAASLTAAFTSVAGTALSGADVFDAAGRRTYTSGVDRAAFLRAVIH